VIRKPIWPPPCARRIEFSHRHLQTDRSVHRPRHDTDLPRNPGLLLCNAICAAGSSGRPFELDHRVSPTRPTGHRTWRPTSTVAIGALERSDAVLVPSVTCSAPWSPLTLSVPWQHHDAASAESISHRGAQSGVGGCLHRQPTHCPLLRQTFRCGLPTHSCGQPNTFGP
jgi:hypothetical protein